MANQVIVTNTGNVQVALQTTPNVQVQISRAAIGTVSNVPTANFANYAANVTGANQPNITNIGTLSSLSVTGNINTPTVFHNGTGIAIQSNAWAQLQYTNSAVAPADQTNIGTGSWFYVDASGAVWESNTTGTSQTVAMDNNGNVSASGNISADYYIGNGSLLTGIVATAGTSIDNGTSNVSIPVANGNIQVYANNQHWTFTDVGNLLLAGGNGVIQSIANSSLDPINPNVSTMVLTPDQGNSSQALVLDPTTPGHIHLRAPGSNIDQPQANVYLGGEASSFEVGVFNGAVPNLYIHSNNNTWMFDITGNLTLPANSFAINYANGTQVPIGSSSNANYANFAGEAFSVSGANVTSEVANANYSSYANIAASANSVALANVSGIGNIANINLTGSSSNVLFGNGVFAPAGGGANANYANFAGQVVDATQSNITQLGNLVDLRINNNSIRLGNNAGVTTPSANSVSIGYQAGSNGNSSSTRTVAIGFNTANVNQGDSAVAIGRASGQLNQGSNAVAIGFSAAGNGQGNGAVAIGSVAGNTLQGFQSVAIGNAAGRLNQGSNSIAIGANAGYTSQANNSIILNATGANLDFTTANSFVVKPVRNANTANVMFYDNSTGEISYDVIANSSVANANYANYAGNAFSVAVGNVSGIGNIATINLDGSSSNVLFGNGIFAPESTSIANANYANFAGTLINGNSNVTIAANSSILISAVGNANIMTVDGNGTIFSNPLAGGYNNWLRLNNYGTTANGQNASRIASFRYRGSSGANLSVQPNDGLMDFLAIGYNGTSLATNSSGRIKAVVDNSYTANVANIPVGWQVQVNDTTAGNNQTKTHNFYSNGNVTFANAIFGNSLSVTGNITGGNISATTNISGNSLSVTGNISGGNISATANISGNIGNFGALQAANTVTIFIDNNTTQGLFQTVYNNANIQTAQWTSWRYRGNSSTPLPVIVGDEVSKFSSIIYGDSGNTYKEVFQQITNVLENDGAGNTAGAYQVIGFGANSVTQFYAKEHQFGNIALNTNAIIYGNGSANVANVSIQSNGFVKLASYTATALNAITGQIGWMASVSDSGGGGNPNGMIAFWDTTHTRWSYIHDNSAV